MINKLLVTAIGIGCAIGGLSLPSLAGRPVIESLSLAELTQQSDAIAIAVKDTPFEVIDSRSGCSKKSWRVKVKTLLKHGSQILPKTDWQVHYNKIEFTDCSLRQWNPGSGASFPASLYKPTQPTTIKTDRQFIIFVKVRQNELQLTADNAVEAVSQRQVLQRLLARKSPLN